MRSFVNALLLLPVFVKMIYKIFLVNEISHKRYLLRIIGSLELQYGESLPSTYAKRFDLYTKIATIFISWLETLRGRQLSRSQKQTALLFCGITPLFDDLLDEEHYSEGELKALIKKQLQRGTLLEKLCIGLYEEMERVQPDLRWVDYWQKAMESQFSSLRQANEQPCIEEIREITTEKGGYALLLYLDAILAGAYTRDEADAIFQMGAIIQLTNDIFDVYKDSRAGIATLATLCSNVEELREEYLTETQKNMRQFTSLEYHPFRIRLFLLHYQLIVSRGTVALDQLFELQHSSGGAFDATRFSRKELVCDMERWPNIRKSLLLTIRSV